MSPADRDPPPDPPTPPDAPDPARRARLLRGWGRLVLDATRELSTVVESMHHTIAGTPALLGLPPLSSPRGLTGLAYGAVRGVARLGALGLDAVARPAPGDAGALAAPPRRDAVRAVLNGIVGDHLAETGNPLAVEMRLRVDGVPLVLERAALAAALPGAGRKVLVRVHGSCHDDHVWLRAGHDHGAALARDLGYTAISLHYNTGRHVSTNGRAFAALLQALAGAWPAPLEELTILAHSMGGLVTRAACRIAAAERQRWLAALRAIAFLGTPHLGAPLERGGSWVDALLGATPFSAPVGRLGRIRSAGVTDLRHGSVCDEDWEGRDRFDRTATPPRHVPLPEGVRCFAVAGALAPVPGLALDLVGDGLVPVSSALGQAPEADRCLDFPEARRHLGAGLGHLDLLSDPVVYARLRDWLGGA